MHISYINEWIDTEEVTDDIINTNDEKLASEIKLSARNTIWEKNDFCNIVKNEIKIYYKHWVHVGNFIYHSNRETMKTLFIPTSVSNNEFSENFVKIEYDANDNKLYIKLLYDINLENFSDAVGGYYINTKNVVHLYRSIIAFINFFDDLKEIIATAIKKIKNNFISKDDIIFNFTPYRMGHNVIIGDDPKKKHYVNYISMCLDDDFCTDVSNDEAAYSVLIWKHIFEYMTDPLIKPLLDKWLNLERVTEFDYNVQNSNIWNYTKPLLVKAIDTFNPSYIKYYINNNLGIPKKDINEYESYNPECQYLINKFKNFKYCQDYYMYVTAIKFNVK